jgi:SsrA-binding protein
MFANNRRAGFDYQIEDTFEAGIILQGTEVKAIRAGKMNIAESYVTIENGTLVLVNCAIEYYERARVAVQHEVRRKRTLLMHTREITKLQNQMKRGMTIIPLNVYQNDRGLLKIKIALATGKKAHDKRAAIKERDWQRDKARVLKGE